MDKKNKGRPTNDYRTKVVSVRVKEEHHEEAKAKANKVLKPYKPKK